MKRCALILILVLCLAAAGAAESAYTVRLGAWVPLYEGPNYDFRYAAAVGEDGVYTIVEEMGDDEGNLWGRLKSGAGWVNLTELRTAEKPVITAEFADEKLLDAGGYTLYAMENSAETVMIAFRAHENLRNVRLSALCMDDAAYAVSEVLHGFDHFFEDTPLVAGLVFPGDMTAYGLSFTDESGAERHFIVSISGRNGAIQMDEYVP